jgi:hypothetical protein
MQHLRRCSAISGRDAAAGCGAPVFGISLAAQNILSAEQGRCISASHEFSQKFWHWSPTGDRRKKFPVKKLGRKVSRPVARNPLWDPDRHKGYRGARGGRQALSRLRTLIIWAANHWPPAGARIPRRFSSSAAFLADMSASSPNTWRSRSARSAACR